MEVGSIKVIYGLSTLGMLDDKEVGVLLVKFNLKLIHNLIKVFLLESVPVYRKYISFLDVLNIIRSPNVCISLNPTKIYLAMLQHRSQLIWFRYLYIIFSRYIFINTYKKLNKEKWDSFTHIDILIRFLKNVRSVNNKIGINNTWYKIKLINLPWIGRRVNR